MSGYFATLAARATMAAPLLRTAAAPVADPFEVTAAMPMSSMSMPMSSMPPSAPVATPPDAGYDRHAPIQTATAILPAVSPNVNEAPGRAEVLAAEPPASLAPHRVAPQAGSPDVIADVRVERPDIAERSISTIQREEIQLLRKADTFMQSILERRTTVVEEHHEERDRLREIERETLVERRVVESPAELLAPATRLAPRATQGEAEAPPLIIGKLTVEVVPPPPAAAPPPRTVIIAAAPRGRYVLPSSRRFGLGQF